MEYAYGRLYVKAYFAFICTPHFADAQRLRLFVSVSELPSATVAGELSGAMPDSHSGGRMAPGPVLGPESAWPAAAGAGPASQGEWQGARPGGQ